MDISDAERARLSDKILTALELALDQYDIKIAEVLVRALELSMTRNTGGGEFIERRDYPAEMEKVMAQLNALREQQDAV